MSALSFHKYVHTNSAADLTYLKMVEKILYDPWNEIFREMFIFQMNWKSLTRRHELDHFFQQNLFWFEDINLSPSSVAAILKRVDSRS